MNLEFRREICPMDINLGFNIMYMVFKAIRQHDITEEVIMDRNEKQSGSLTLRIWGDKEEQAEGNWNSQRDRAGRCDALKAKGITCYRK